MNLTIMNEDYSIATHRMNMGAAGARRAVAMMNEGRGTIEDVRGAIANIATLRAEWVEAAERVDAAVLAEAEAWGAEEAARALRAAAVAAALQVLGPEWKAGE